MLVRFRTIAALLLSSLLATTVSAADPTQEREVELFQAIEAGEITAEVIAPSPRQIYLRVDNQTTEMLSIKLPKAFAAVPVLAQMQPGMFPGGGPGLGMGPLGMGQMGMGQQFGPGMGQNQGGSQGLGGGFNGAGQGNQIGNGFGLGQGNQFGNQIGNQFGNGFGRGNAMGRGMFRVPAGRVGKVSAQSFCLEYGKPDPTSKIKYRIVPLDEFVGSDERIVSLCHLLAEGSISQNVAQAVAWNLANNLSFEQMAGINRVQSKYTGNVRMFSEDELKLALQLSQKLSKAAQANSQDSSQANSQPASLNRSLDQASDLTRYRRTAD